MHLSSMYLRPGNLWKSLRLKRRKVVKVYGDTKVEYEDTGKTVTGILAEVENSQSERTKHLWDQSQHTLTHTMVVRGKADLKKGDFLAYDEKAYLVLYNDDVGELGIAGMVYLEERNDIK